MCRLRPSTLLALSRPRAWTWCGPAVVRVGLGAAEQIFQTGEGRPLLDWLQERSGEVAAEVGRVRRPAAR
jgi:hypothetical protein